MKKFTLEKVMGVSIILMFMCLLVVGCPSSGSSPSPTASAGMCENGTPTPSTTDNEEFCKSCDDGFALRNNLCISTTLDTDGDSVPDINELPSCVDNADCDDDMVADNIDIDDDNNGLIEISSLEMLHNMRFDLAGSSYKTSADGTGNTDGSTTSAPASGANNCNAAGLCGYELVRDLDFDSSDADDRTWTGGTAGADSTFTLDMDDNNATYFPVAEGGWLPIGDNTNPFTGIFDGRGLTISNLAISRSQQYVGFFGYSRGQIRNIGLINVLANSTSTSDHNVGGLVGQHDNGSITASYTTGFVHAGDATSSNSARVGGLVGLASSSNVASIRASYSTAHVNGGSGNSDRVGGLVGRQNSSRVNSSYATGTVFSGSGTNDAVGGLVGSQNSYPAHITNSYATGTATGNFRGRLIGLRDNGNDLHSFGFASVAGTGGTVSMLGAPPAGITAVTLTAANVNASSADNEWDTTVWNFGTTSQTPALNYADYDGSDNRYHCSNASNPPARAILVVNCGTLIPGQR